MGQPGPHVHFSIMGLITDFCLVIALGIAAMQDTSGLSGFTCAGVAILTVRVGDGGMGQSALASDKLMSVGSVVGHGVSSLI